MYEQFKKLFTQLLTAPVQKQRTQALNSILELTRDPDFHTHATNIVKDCLQELNGRHEKNTHYETILNLLIALAPHLTQLEEETQNALNNTCLNLLTSPDLLIYTASSSLLKLLVLNTEKKLAVQQNFLTASQEILTDCARKGSPSDESSRIIHLIFKALKELPAVIVKIDDNSEESFIKVNNQLISIYKFCFEKFPKQIAFFDELFCEFVSALAAEKINTDKLALDDCFNLCTKLRSSSKNLIQIISAMAVLTTEKTAEKFLALWSTIIQSETKANNFAPLLALLDIVKNISNDEINKGFQNTLFQVITAILKQDPSKSPVSYLSTFITYLNDDTIVRINEHLKQRIDEESLPKPQQTTANWLRCLPIPKQKQTVSYFLSVFLTTNRPVDYKSLFRIVFPRLEHETYYHALNEFFSAIEKNPNKKERLQEILTFYLIKAAKFTINDTEAATIETIDALFKKEGDLTTKIKLQQTLANLPSACQMPFLRYVKANHSEWFKNELLDIFLEKLRLIADGDYADLDYQVKLNHHIQHHSAELQNIIDLYQDSSVIPAKFAVVVCKIFLNPVDPKSANLQALLEALKDDSLRVEYVKCVSLEKLLNRLFVSLLNEQGQLSENSIKQVMDTLFIHTGDKSSLRWECLYIFAQFIFEHLGRFADNYATDEDFVQVSHELEKIIVLLGSPHYVSPYFNKKLVETNNFSLFMDDLVQDKTAIFSTKEIFQKMSTKLFQEIDTAKLEHDAQKKFVREASDISSAMKQEVNKILADLKKQQETLDNEKKHFAEEQASTKQLAETVKRQQEELVTREQALALKEQEFAGSLQQKAQEQETRFKTEKEAYALEITNLKTKLNQDNEPLRAELARGIQENSTIKTTLDVATQELAREKEALEQAKLALAQEKNQLEQARAQLAKEQEVVKQFGNRLFQHRQAVSEIVYAPLQKHRTDYKLTGPSTPIKQGNGMPSVSDSQKKYLNAIDLGLKKIADENLAPEAETQKIIELLNGYLQDSNALSAFKQNPLGSLTSWGFVSTESVLKTMVETLGKRVTLEKQETLQKTQ